MDSQLAINGAVDSCVNDGILIDILQKHRLEVTQVLLTEYDEKLHIDNEKNISYEEGMAEGREEGRAEGRAEGREEGLTEGITLVSDVFTRLLMGEDKSAIIESGISEDIVNTAEKLINKSNQLRNND